MVSTSSSSSAPHSTVETGFEARVVAALTVVPADVLVVGMVVDALAADAADVLEVDALVGAVVLTDVVVDTLALETGVGADARGFEAVTDFRAGEGGETAFETGEILEVELIVELAAGETGRERELAGVFVTVAGVVTGGAAETEAFDNAANESREAKPVVAAVAVAGEAGADECIK